MAKSQQNSVEGSLPGDDSVPGNLPSAPRFAKRTQSGRELRHQQALVERGFHEQLSNFVGRGRVVRSSPGNAALRNAVATGPGPTTAALTRVLPNSAA
jgi:hypothetical protein